MDSFKSNPKRKIIVITVAVIAVIAIIFTVFAIYVGDYYHADTDAIDAFASTKDVEYKQLDSGMAFGNENSKVGLIFYPGGKVEYTAYIPLMSACAEDGIFCVLAEMPFNLAVFDVDAAEEIQKSYPEIDSWYIGGHSLGGSMAASHLSKNAESFDGLILLASYSTANLSDSGIRALSVFGSCDGVLNKEKYEENKVNLPTDFTEKVIDVPKYIDNEVAERKIRFWGMEIDKLTDVQEAYLNSWEA